MRRLSTTTAILFLFSWGGTAAAQEPAAAESPEKDEEPTALNTLYFEGLGPGGLYSLNYERRIADFNVRAGFAYFSNDFYSMTTIPIGFNYIGVGNSSAHFEVGGVATIAIIDGDGFLGNAAGVFATALAGFRYQPKDGGFNFRVGASPLLGTLGVVPWGYLSLGGTFGGGAKRKARAAEPSGDFAWGADQNAPPKESVYHARKKSTAKAPTGLGGFEFSMSADEARTICQGSGHSWNEEDRLASCSAPVKRIGLEGTIQMQRCGTEFCQLLLTAPLDESRLVTAVGKLKTALERTYGKPTSSKSAIPQDCANTLAACIEEQRAYLEYVWDFPDGEAIKLRLGKRRLPGEQVEGSDTNLRLLYKRKPPATISLDATETPLGFAGFRFAMTPEEAKATCEASGNSWSESSGFGGCSAPANELGIDGKVQMRRCGGEFCQVLFTAEPAEASIVSDVAELKSAIERQYGPPSISNSAIPQDCTDNLAECLDTQRAYLNYIWEFPNGEAIKLRVGKKAEGVDDTEEADHKVRVLSTRPVPSSSDPAAEADPNAL